MPSQRSEAMSYARQMRGQSGRVQPDNFGSRPKTGQSSDDYQDNRRGYSDPHYDETRPLRAEEKKVEDDHEKDIVDKSSFDKGKDNGTAIVPTSTTGNRKAAEPEFKTPFAKMWTSVDNINIPRKVLAEKSFFSANAIALFETLHCIESILANNEELRWSGPNYFSLPVRLYYAVIFHIQVLRAKEQSGSLTKQEGSLLKAFFQRFKDTSCVIAGPLVPYFSNIVSYLPDDAQFAYVYPKVDNDGTFTVSKKDGNPQILTVKPNHHLFPSVPMLAGMMKKFCDSEKLDESNFENENFVPFKLVDGGNVAGVEFPKLKDISELPSNFVYLINNPAIMHPLPESKERLREIHHYWKRSNIRHIPSPTPQQGFSPTSIAECLLMSEEFDWFEACLEDAIIQAKFLSDNSNLSAIPTVGGQSAVVEALLELKKPRNDRPTTAKFWFPESFSGLTSKFRTTVAVLGLDHAFQSACTLTNATLPWKDANGNPIGSVASGAKGGPFWDNTKYNYELEYPTPVLVGLRPIIQTMFYEAHGLI